MPFSMVFRFALLLVATGWLASCTALRAPAAPEGESSALPDCYLVFDAGSSGTRLHAFVAEDGHWRNVALGKAGALADPVREIRGKRHDDIASVVDSVVALLDTPVQTGFDWRTQCTLRAVKAYATGGMRLAEQQDVQRSQQMWQQLHNALADKVGADVDVEARTLSGFEEGLFAWLAASRMVGSTKFGLVEMGGASSQVVFPCKDCEQDDAVRKVLVDGKPMLIHSYSFLGLGLDEAPVTVGMPAACAYGAGGMTPVWQPQQCQRAINLQTDGCIRDPLNYAVNDSERMRKMDFDNVLLDRWLLTGAFRYMDEANIVKCCLTQGDCYDAERSCFRENYLRRYLDALNVPQDSARMETSWTLGAILCAETDCLRDAAPMVCRWRTGGCL